MAFTYIVGWLFTIVLCFTMGNPHEILNSPVAQPVAQIFYNVLGKSGGIFFTVAAFIILMFVCFTAEQALARTIFAFSRDNLLPFSRVWTKIHPLTGTPLNAVAISIFCCIAINLIGLGSYTAIAGVFNVCAIALDWSYCKCRQFPHPYVNPPVTANLLHSGIPIFCKLVFGKFEPGPWYMGKVGYFVNAWACIWTAFVAIIFVMPTALPVSAETVSAYSHHPQSPRMHQLTSESWQMNYAVVYLAGILAFAAIYWYAYGKRFYTGPIIEAKVEDEAFSNDVERSSDDNSMRKRNIVEKEKN